MMESDLALTASALGLNSFSISPSSRSFARTRHLILFEKAKVDRNERILSLRFVFSIRRSRTCPRIALGSSRT
jgi:hypothetical protein